MTGRREPVHVIARVRERGTGARDEPERRSDLLHAEAVNYDEARAQILRRLAPGWIVASWRVERT